MFITFLATIIYIIIFVQRRGIKKRDLVRIFGRQINARTKSRKKANVTQKMGRRTVEKHVNIALVHKLSFIPLV